jgi:hypothetical protein
MTQNGLELQFLAYCDKSICQTQGALILIALDPRLTRAPCESNRFPMIAGSVLFVALGNLL